MDTYHSSQLHLNWKLLRWYENHCTNLAKKTYNWDGKTTILAL